MDEHWATVVYSWKKVAASKPATKLGRGCINAGGCMHGTSALHIALQTGTGRCPSDTLTPMPHVAP